MRSLEVVDGQRLTLSLTFEDVRLLGLACHVAAVGDDANPMKRVGLPAAYTPEAQPMLQAWELYQAALEGVGWAMLCKGYAPMGSGGDVAGVGHLRRLNAPTVEELEPETWKQRGRVREQGEAARMERERWEDDEETAAQVAAILANDPGVELLALQAARRIRTRKGGKGGT